MRDKRGSEPSEDFAVGVMLIGCVQERIHDRPLGTTS